MKSKVITYLLTAFGAGGVILWSQTESAWILLLAFAFGTGLLHTIEDKSLAALSGAITSITALIVWCLYCPEQGASLIATFLVLSVMQTLDQYGAYSLRKRH